MRQENKPNINIITKRMQHHAGHSGYDILLDYLDTNTILSNSKFTLLQRIIARLFLPMIRRSACIWYHRESFIVELSAALSWIKNSDQIFHFIYGENSYNFLGYFKLINKSNKIVCTYHVPEKRFHEIFSNTDQIKKLDFVVVVSTVQYELFSNILGADKVKFVPHGIDVDYFCPESDKEINKNNYSQCLFVGSHLRDPETMASAIKIVNSLGKNIRFCIVTSNDNFIYFKDIANVELFSGISDKELLKLYQESDLLTLPLLDCTANNGILEALACGLPIISTDLQGVRDYVDARCAILSEPGDANKLAENIVSLSQDTARIKNMSAASRKKSLEFRWEVIGAQINEIYNTLTLNK